MQEAKDIIIIDAVITWVNSSDGVWQQKINNYLQKKIDWDNKKDSTRYNSLNEVEIAILSIIKYAPFIKNIFLVTDNQEPENFIKLQNKANAHSVNLELVDHKVIFRNYKNHLPTFNSCSIITMLYQIPNLSEHFVVFNDDTFLMRETNEEDFFKNGEPIIRGRWDSYYEDKLFRNILIKIKYFFKKQDQKKVGYKSAQQKSAKLLGFKKYIRRDHTPVSIRKSTIEDYFNQNPKILDNNIKHRFRDSTQFIISSLSNHLEVKKGTFILKKDFQLSYFQSYDFFQSKLRLKMFDNIESKKFMCFQSLELAPKKTLKLILHWIDEKLETNFRETIN
jgi:hypothetical protein